MCKLQNWSLGETVLELWGAVLQSLGCRGPDACARVVGRRGQPSCMLYCSMSSMRSMELESCRLMVRLSREEAPACSTCS